MKAKTISLSPEINKSLDKSDIIPTKILTTVKDNQAGLTITPSIDNEALKVMRNCSIWHKKCLKVVAQDVTLNGYRITSTNKDKQSDDSEHKTLLEDIFDDYDNQQALFKVMRDYRTYTHAAFELKVNLEGQLRGFKHIRAGTIEMCEGGEKALQKIGGKSVYFRVYGNVKKEHEDIPLDQDNGIFSSNVAEEKQASTIVWLTDGCEDSDYYHEPEYLPATQTILSDEALESYNYAGLATNGIPNFLVMIAGDFEEGVDEDGLSWDEELENTFQDVPNKPGTAIVYPIKTTGKDSGMVIEVHKLADPIQEGSYTKLAESNMNKILAAHDVPPSRLGIVYNGPLGGSVDEERNKLYDTKTINPLQLMLDTIINRLITDLLEITDYKHEFVRLDTRNVKGELEIAKELVTFAAMTPAQLLQSFGDHFNLNIDINELLARFPELDQYYMNGQLLGSTPNPEITKAVMQSYDILPEKIARILDNTADRIEGIQE